MATLNMFKIKYLLSLLVMLLLFNTYSQNYGGLYVKGFKNTTLKLKDNIQFDSVFVKVINQATGEEQSIIFTTDSSKRPLLETGTYTIVCTVNGEEERTLEDVKVMGDSIAFIQLLYEPKQKLTFKQKRKRKKEGFAYSR